MIYMIYGEVPLAQVVTERAWTTESLKTASASFRCQCSLLKPDGFFFSLEL